MLRKPLFLCKMEITNIKCTFTENLECYSSSRGNRNFSYENSEEISESFDRKNFIKFCGKMAYDESSICRTRFQFRYKRFMERPEDVNGPALSVCPNTTNELIEAVKKKILDNRRITIREVADDVGTSFG